MTEMNIDELALKVRNKTGFPIFEEDLPKFAHELIAEYEKTASSEPVAEFGSIRLTPEGTTEFYGWLHCDQSQMKRGDKLYPRPDPRVSELEAQNARLTELNSQLCSKSNSYVIYNARLEEQNAALLVAIEAKDAAIEVGLRWVPDDFIAAGLVQAKAIPPSTELLEERDRKRDAKLLRAAEEASDDDGFPVDFWRLADARESGEWNPELGG